MYFRPNLNICESMICARSQVYNKAYTLSVNGQKIRKVDKLKFLGVFIDDKLSWDYQIEHIENKLLSKIVLIKRIKKFIPRPYYMKIYHYLFLSHLTYGITCWGGTYKSKLQRIFNLQKRCVRILFGEIYIHLTTLNIIILVPDLKHLLNIWHKKSMHLTTQNQFLINTTYLTCIVI